MSTFLLVDGSNLLFQMFYGMPTRITNHAGRPIQGTLGFVGALLKIIRRTAPSHIAVIFDGEHPNPRAEIAAEYKANRPDYSMTSPDETPFSQLPDIYAALDYLKIRHVETSSCEADDLIASYTDAAPNDTNIIIVSYDSDLFQRIDDRTSILRYRGEKTVIWEQTMFFEKFGISPKQYIDFKALVGDPSDNIKGAPRIGPKTAAALLNQFDTLDAILANTGCISSKNVRTSLEENTDLLRRNVRLIALDTRIKLPFSYDMLAYTDTDCSTNDVLRAIGLR